MHACYWDREVGLTVRISNGMDLLSAAEDDMLIQPLNATIIGGEVVQYATAVDKWATAACGSCRTSCAGCAAPSA